jgi:hypothetical protein
MARSERRRCVEALETICRFSLQIKTVGKRSHAEEFEDESGTCRNSCDPISGSRSDVREQRLSPDNTLNVMVRQFFIVLALVLPSAAWADPLPRLEPKIVSVQTVARWVDGRSSGRYKVIVTTEGWEHVWSRVYVEWLPDPSNPNDDWKSTAIAELVPPGAQGTMILDAMAQRTEQGSVVITVHATPNQDFSELGIRKSVFTFEATTPGMVNLLDTALL